MTATNNGNSVRFHRVLKAPVDRVFRAFTDSSAKCKWLPPYGYTAALEHNDVREGGTYRMSFTSFQSGETHSFGGKYVELKANERIRYTDKFDDPNMPGEMQITVELREVSCGTELKIVQENIPTQIPAEMCYLGWQESLAQLARLVEG